MDLDFSEVPQAVLEARLRSIYLFLRYGWACEEAALHPEATQAGKAFAKLLAYPGAGDDLKTIREWPGVGPNTEIVLLSSLAPGADTIAARVLLDLGKDPRFPNFRTRVRVVLPFPEALYLDKATTFANPDHSQKINTFRSFDEEIVAEDRFIAYLDEDLREFPVRLAESTEAPENAGAESSLRKQFVADLEDKSARDRRYQAAGEYVASFCDVLIAIYDDRSNSGSRAGSNQIVEAKRWGVTPGLLPHSQANTWADNGPVMHLYHPRLKTKTDQDGHPEPGVRSVTPLRLLHPYNLGPKDDNTRNRLSEVWTIDELDEKDPHERKRLEHALETWHSQGNEIAVRIGRNFREFNDRPAKIEKEADEIEKLTGRTLNDDNISRHLRLIDPIARVRCRAKSLNYPLHDRFKGTLKRLFLVTFFAALLLHLFSHWHPQFHEATAGHGEPAAAETTAHPAATKDHGKDHATAATSHEAMEKRYKRIRFGLGAGATILAVVGLIGFLRFVGNRIEERRHDYRALSEALRIQFYWGMAGLRRSVASNYMQRIRSEMDWIRNAVSSLTFPSERFQHSFLKLSRTDQVEILRMTVRQWLRPPIHDRHDAKRDGSRQEDYFLTTYERESGRLHFFHQTGSCIALAGLLQALWLVCFIKRKGLGEALLHSPEYLDWPRECLLIGLGLLFVSLVCGVYHRLSHGHGPAAPHGFRQALLQPWLNPESWLGLSFSGILSDIFFHRHSSREKFNKADRFILSLVNFAFALIPAAGLTLVLLGFLVALARLGIEMPGPLDLGIVSMGACLVGGALLIAYAERQLLSEHAYQYKASYAFFANTRLRLEKALENLDTARGWAEEPDEFGAKASVLWKAKKAAKLSVEQNRKIEIKEVPDPQTEEEKSEARSLLIAQGEAEFIQYRERIHQLLYALGKEALDENSEWLILHRSRPMEPVMAG